MICCWILSHNRNCSMIEEERNFSHTDVCVFLVQQLLHYGPTFHPHLHQTHSHSHLHSYSSYIGSFVMCSPYMVIKCTCFLYTQLLYVSDCVNVYCMALMSAFWYDQSTIQFKCPLWGTVFHLSLKLCTFNGSTLSHSSIQHFIIHYNNIASIFNTCQQHLQTQPHPNLGCYITWVSSHSQVRNRNKHILGVTGCMEVQNYRGRIT